MPQKITFKVILIVFIVAMFGYFLVPTIQFNTMTKDEQRALEIENPQRYKELAKKSIKLGLDLQGGMNVVLEVDFPELMRELANERRRNDQTLLEALEAAGKEYDAEGGDIVVLLDQALQERGSNIAQFYSNRDRRSREEVIEYLQEQRDESVERALEVLRNRIDQFGVSEPLIQKQGDNRVVVELAGISNRQQALELIGKTAKLEFNLLRDLSELQRVTARINDYILGETDSDSAALVAEDSVIAEEGDEETVTAEDIFGQGESDSAATDSTGLAAAEEPLFLVTQNQVFIRENRLPQFDRLLASPDVRRIIDQEVGQGKGKLLAQSPSTAQEAASDAGPGLLEVYLVNQNAELTGKTIIDSRPRAANVQELEGFGTYETDITFNDEGTRLFSSVTGANVGKRMAITLDDRVRSAPNIRDKIRNGRARITGLETFDEARMLSSVLKAGALPAPLTIIEERTVGASLGEDSVSKGFYSALLGLALVAVFMVIYYKASGILADLALVLNILILLGFMSRLHATLTLPGIAGIILTIGMAVDANVLIFERIREELDRGKSLLVSLETGYARAFITILDANVTTFIAAIVLYNFGSGPVRGFATTLMIGIAASMFTAIFVTRTLFELLLTKKIIKRLSI